MMIYYNGVGYVASINQKGVAVTKYGNTMREALTLCWHDYLHYLKG